MNKEEILKLNKQENKRFDEMEKGAIIDACNKAYRIGRFLCALVLIVDIIFTQNVNYSIWFIFVSMTSIYLLYKYKFSRKRRDIILGIIYALLGIIFFVMHIISII